MQFPSSFNIVDGVTLINANINDVYTNDSCHVSWFQQVIQRDVSNAQNLNSDFTENHHRMFLIFMSLIFLFKMTGQNPFTCRELLSVVRTHMELKTGLPRTAYCSS